MIARMFLLPRVADAALGTGQNCMTLHDALASGNRHFLSFPEVRAGCQKSGVYPGDLPMKKGVWLGPESNRRHVDFQSTALPTELPSQLPMRIAIFSGKSEE